MSARSLTDLPPTSAEIAFVGRSNVGKSSLVNSLANRRQLARVSNTPGRTQSLNLFSLREGGTIVDLPGYGYAAAPAKVRASWGPMIEGYLLGREPLVRVLALVDGEIGPTKLDVQLLEWLGSYDVPLTVIATKHDKVRSSRLGSRKKQVAEGCGLPRSDIVWVSAAKGTGIDRLRGLVREWLAGDGQATK